MWRRLRRRASRCHAYGYEHNCSTDRNDHPFGDNHDNGKTHNHCDTQRSCDSHCDGDSNDCRHPDINGHHHTHNQRHHNADRNRD